MKIAKPLFNNGSKHRDFGQCFYTTYDLRTAKNWAKKNFHNFSVTNKYSINLENMMNGTLKIKVFQADAEWAEFVYKNRNVGEEGNFARPDYDIIIGPIADRGLKKEFLKIKTNNKTFAEIAPLIHYNKFKSLQVAFCTEYAVSMLNLI